MNREVDSLVIDYADALKHANTGMCGTWPTVPDHAGIPCTPQMARLHDAEHAVLGLSGRPDLPEPVAAFIAAKDDAGCPSCWVSPNRSTIHPECQKKIDRYFSAREALKMYGEAPARKLASDR